MKFSPKQFRDALQESTKLSQRLEKYLLDTRKAKVDVMYGMVEEFFKILSDKQTPLLKVNSLFALQLFLQTCQYPAVEMTEAFLLPLLQEIAFYQSDKRTYVKTSQYFKDRGYPGSTPNLQQLSHNYVILATNLLFLAAAAKPHNYFYTDHLSTPSAFKIQVDKLKLKKVEVSQYGKQWNQKYEANLIRFGNTPDYEANYVNLFKEKVEKHLLEGGKARETLDFRRILKNGDSWLSSQLLGCLNEALLEDNFSSRRLALGLLNDLFLSGDIEAIMIVNEGEAVENVCERIMEVKGSSDLGRGTQIYPEIPGQLDIKKNFYIEFLRCLQNWAKLVPTSIYLTQSEETRVAKLYRKFKQKQFIFPSNDLSQRLTKQFEQNMKLNQQRNNYIIQTLNEGESSRNHSVASNRLSKYSQKISLIKEMRQSTILSLPQIQKLIQEAEQALVALPQSEKDVSKNMKTLKYFSEQFEKKFELIEESVTESRLETTYVKGLRCLEKIEQITPIYSDYQNGRIDYKKFAENVKNKCSHIDKNKSKMSDILSKLSKSKEINSRSGLELSHSQHTVKPKEPDLNKADFVLQKQANIRERISQTRTIMNMSNLEEDPLSSGNNKGSSKEEISSKYKQDELKPKESSKLSKKEDAQAQEISLISKSQESLVQKVQPKGTAKFIVHDQYSLKPIISKQQSFGKQISKQSSKLSMKQENSRQDKNSSNQASSRPSAHFNQNRSPFKQKQQFSDQSSWSESDEEKPKRPSQEQQKQKSSFKSAFNTSKKYHTEKTEKAQKSREVFSSSSFSQYNQSNEELRQVIDKSQNPDFKMIFNKSSLHSKMSKHTGQSHEHYMGVLQSLAPKSIEQPQREISHHSKDKSTSQLPPKSHFDTSSRMEGHRSNHKLTASSGFKEKMILENEPQILEIKKSEIKSNGHEKPSKIFSQEEKKMSSSNQIKNSSKIQLGPKTNKSSSSKHNSGLNQYEVVQKPQKYELQQPHVIQPSIHRQQSHSKHSSIHLPKQTSIYQSKQQYAVKENQYYNTQKNSSKLSSSKSGINLSQVNVIKQQKIKQIQELEARIRRLKQDQKKLKTGRSEWLSPTRPQTLRTAISPRFRNNQTNYTHSLQSFKQIDHERAQRRRHQFIKQHRGEQMNFDVVDLFRPPEGRLIYHRLYKKDLLQLDLKQKKKILKNKDLVFRNQDIQIGLIVHKQSKDLKIIYYITANLFLKTFLFKVEPSSKMAVHLIPNSLSNLQPRKQYRIYIFAEVLQFPYKMPVLQFKYHPELLTLQQNLFAKNQINYFTSIIPFFFVKFLTMRAVTPDKIVNQWNSGEIIRSEETIYSRKVLPKHFYILQYFPQLTNLQSKQYETVYGMECQYGSTRFLVKIVLKINKFMYIQGVLTGTKDKQNSEKIMEFAICCMSSLLTKNSEMMT